MAAEGFQVYGDPDSPVVPCLLYHPTKMPAFSRLCLERGIAVGIDDYQIKMARDKLLTAVQNFAGSATGATTAGSYA